MPLSAFVSFSSRTWAWTGSSYFSRRRNAACSAVSCRRTKNQYTRKIATPMPAKTAQNVESAIVIYSGHRADMLEHLRRKRPAGSHDPIGALGPDSRGTELPAHAAFVADAQPI